MTSPAIKLAIECGIYGGKVQNIEGEDGYWVEDVSEKTMERFYAKAQAQALRDAAAEYMEGATKADVSSRVFLRDANARVAEHLRRRADELERGA